MTLIHPTHGKQLNIAWVLGNECYLVSYLSPPKWSREIKLSPELFACSFPLAYLVSTPLNIIVLWASGVWTFSSSGSRRRLYHSQPWRQHTMKRKASSTTMTPATTNIAHHHMSTTKKIKTSTTSPSHQTTTAPRQAAKSPPTCSTIQPPSNKTVDCYHASETSKHAWTRSWASSLKRSSANGPRTNTP